MAMAGSVGAHRAAGTSPRRSRADVEMCHTAPKLLAAQATDAFTVRLSFDESAVAPADAAPSGEHRETATAGADAESCAQLMHIEA